MKLLAVILFASACGTPARGDDDTVTPDATPRCTDATSVAAVLVSPLVTSTGTTTRPWRLDAVVNPTTALAHTQDANGAMRVALVDQNGATDIGLIDGAGNYSFHGSALDRGDGKRCAVYISGKGGLFLGCEGAAQEAAGIADTDADHVPLPFVHSDGSLSVFTQAFAAFTEIVRSPAGMWSDVEQFESSISYPEDVASLVGEPTVCFIDDARRAVIKLGNSRMASTATTSSCKLAYDGATLHVLTDAGYASPSGTTFDATPVDALAGKHASRIVVVAGKPYALGVDGKSLVATPLPSGAPTTLATTTDDGDAVIGWNDATGAAHFITTKLDTSGTAPYPQTFTFQTRCFE